MRRVVLAVAVLLGAIVSPGTPGLPGTKAPTTEAAASDIIALVVEGTGFGHGRGMSQWGAYGWAVDQGRTWQQILDHYYGGTTLGDAPAGSATMTVRLLGYDNVGTVDVTSAVGGVAWNNSAIKYTSMRAVWNGSAYDVYGANTRTCSVPQTTKLGSVAEVTFSITNGDVAGTAAENTLGLCRNDGSVVHYRGTLRMLNSGGLRLVNTLTTENYLRGVVPREVAASWANAGNGAGAHAVRAQAVAARSYALAQNRYLPYAKTCDTTSCQAYGGAARRPTATANLNCAANPRPIDCLEHPLSDAAITATVNKVRLRNGAVVSTEFSASNGPRTAGGAFPPVDDTPGDSTSRNPNHRWTRVLDADAVAIRYGLGRLTSASMAPAAQPQYQGFDGIWFNDIVLTGTSGSVRMNAWGGEVNPPPSRANTPFNLRTNYSLPSPGFTISVVTRGTTTKTFGMIGDSVGNSIAGSPTAEFSTLIDGTFASARLDMKDSRCTVNLACPRPSGVEAVASLPANLDLVVVQLGYNDWSPDMATVIDTMMRALNARGVRQVAWVNLAAATAISTNASVYAGRNAALQAAKGRWSNLSILDWNAASNTAEKTRWFNADGVHLTLTGQAKFAVWLRGQVSTLAPPGPAPYRLTPQRRLEIPVIGQTIKAPDGTTTTVPANATAVMLNATAVTPSGPGYFALWPCGGSRPVASSLNFATNEIVSNGIVAPIGANGKVCLYTHATSDVVVDVTGWIANDAASPAQHTSIIPERLADSRDGTGIAQARVGAGKSVAIQVTGRSVKLPNGTTTTVPTTASAAAINVISVESSADGFLTVWPCGTPLPVASTLNYRAREIRANGSILSLGSGGKICVYAHQTTDIVMDLTGWFTGAPSATSKGFVSAVPDRWVDTRIGVGAPKAKVQRSKPLVIPVVGRQLMVGSSKVAIPAGVNAVAVNVVAVDPVEPGFTTLWSCDGAVPTASNVNYAARTITANNAVVPVGKGGAICLHVHTTTDIVVDVTGWFNNGSLFTAAGPDRLVDSRVPLGPRPI